MDGPPAGAVDGGVRHLADAVSSPHDQEIGVARQLPLIEQAKGQAEAGQTSHGCG